MLSHPIRKARGLDGPQFIEGEPRVKSLNGPPATFTSLPWGDVQASTGSDTDAYHYAMLDYDSETNTDHAQFRQFANTAGSWMSPDPYFGSYDFATPQSFNRYSYTMNNPLSMTDPMGLKQVCVTSKDPDDPNGTRLTCYDDAPQCGNNNFSVCVNGGGNDDPGIGNIWLLTNCGYCKYPERPPQREEGGIGGRGGGGIAPSNAQQSKQLKCAGETLKKNGVSLALDAAGFIPGESQLAAGAQTAVAGASFVNSLYQKDAYGATSAVVGGQITGVGWAATRVGASWAKAVPVVGYFFNAVGTGRDLWSTYGDYQSCMSHP